MRVLGQELGDFGVARRTRGDAGAAKFHTNGGAGGIGVVGLDMSHPIFMHVAAQQHRVGHRVFAQGI